MKKSDEQERNIANRLYNLSFQSIIRIRENY